MMPIEGSVAAGAAGFAVPLPIALQQGGIAGLPAPFVDGSEPLDALGKMLLALEQSGQLTMKETETRIQNARAELREQLQGFLQKIAESIEAAKRAQEEEDDGGFFDDLFEAVADIAGTIVGTIADFACDVVATPIELVVDVAKNLGDTQAMMAAIRSDMLDVVRNGDVADSVRGFTSGVLEFGADAAAFGVKLSVELSQAAATGRDPMAALEEPLQELWASCKKNILDNPHFWEVAGVVAKAAAVAGAVATGGVLGAAALVAMAALEVDARTGFIEKAVGEGAAPYVRLGLGLAASAAMAFAASGSGQFLRVVQGTTSIVEGAGAVYTGYRTIVDGAARADEMDRQAQIQTMKNRMDQLQRFISELIDVLRDQSESGTTRQEIGSDLVSTQAATQQAALFPA